MWGISETIGLPAESVRAMAGAWEAARRWKDREAVGTAARRAENMACKMGGMVVGAGRTRFEGANWLGGGSRIQSRNQLNLLLDRSIDHIVHIISP